MMPACSSFLICADRVCGSASVPTTEAISAGAFFPRLATISVNGAVYKMEMPGLPTLSDAEIAAALTYVRREWEHGADPVEEKTISAVREAAKDRADLWTAKELLEIK